ncbi:MAG: ATP-binding protein [Actinomycetes bacterium]
MRLMGASTHQASSLQLATVNPLALATSTCPPGSSIGLDLYGREFRFDPFDAYEAQLVTNPNLLIFGQIGRGKSALVKGLIYRALLRGQAALVVDPKGEYVELARVLGGSVIALKPGGSLRLNPLDAALSDGGSESKAELLSERLGLLASLLRSSLGRRLNPAELLALELAVEEVSVNTNPTIPLVVAALLRPSPEAARGSISTVTQLTADGRDLGLGLRRLVSGDLRGMFDAQTSRSIDMSAALVVVDVSATYDSDAMGLVMICVLAFLQSRSKQGPRRRSLLVVDEAWALLRERPIAEWLQASWKLARSRGLANIAVLHRVSDLLVSGGAREAVSGIAKGLLADSETRILYAQPRSELETVRELLGLGDHEAELLASLSRGRALWSIGTQLYAVQHCLQAAERSWSDTDAVMRSMTQG